MWARSNILSYATPAGNAGSELARSKMAPNGHLVEIIDIVVSQEELIISPKRAT